ncbi:MATE family efflux transporter [Yoonia sp. 208BN28-4]|uniref:MATE family efflux transporter n=1 Tax=Yoonia sp. 208BN28-4 TaxID=3126505 RepID=UPI0030A31BC8
MNTPSPSVQSVPAQSYAQHSSAIFRLGLPLALSNMAQFAIHITDTLMLGRYDVTALAAATIATTLFFVTFIVGAGFATAVTPMVAAAAEEADDQKVRRVTRMGLWLSIIYGIVFTIPFMWSEDILLFIGQEPEVAAAAHDYLLIAAWQMVPALLVMTLKAFFVALEKTAMILIATIGIALLNVVFNYALIFGNLGMPELGLQGAAIASLLGNLIGLAVLTVYALRATPQFKLLQNFHKPDREYMARVYALGWPIGLTSLAEGGLFSATAVMMGWIGTIELAAHGIAIQLASLTFMVHLALSQAATVRAGRALGRRDEVALRRGGAAAIFMSLVFAAVTMIGFWGFPEFLIALFLDSDEPQRVDLIAVGVGLLFMAGLFQIVDALQVMALGLLRGVLDTTVPMIMATVSYWVIGMPVAYLLAFPLGMGGVGLWLGLVVGLTVAAVLLFWRFWWRSVFIDRVAP